MKTIYNKPFTLEEFVEEARKRNEQAYRQYARHLCSKEDIVTYEHGLAPYFYEECKGDNLDTVMRWLKAYLADEGLMFDELDLEACIDAFRSELHNRVPPNNWGGA